MTCPLLRVPPELFLQNEELVWKTLNSMQVGAEVAVWL